MSWDESMGKFKKFQKHLDTEFIPTGSIIFDATLGGGIPKGHFIELTSPAGLGKSTSVLHFSKNICSNDGKVLYLDFERGVNMKQVESMGLSPYFNKNFFLVQPATFEDAEEILNEFLSEELSLVIIDSLSAMLPGKSLNASVSDEIPAIKARYQSAWLVKYKIRAKESNVPFIFINQMRNKLSFIGPTTMVASGGNAVAYYMDIRLQMAQDEFMKRKDEGSDTAKESAYGVHVRLWATKSRFSRPYIEKIVTIYFGLGISDIAAYVRLLLKEDKVLKKGGGGYYKITLTGEEVTVRGDSELQAWIKNNVIEVRKYIDEHFNVELKANSDEDVE